jgi:hypothetical protein
MKKWKVFLDLDGVLVDAQLPLMALWDARIGSEDEYPTGFYWDIQGAINFVRQSRGLSALPHTPNQFWSTMSRDWWYHLPLYPTAINFVRWLETGPFDICLATASVNSDSAAAKVDYIHRLLPEYDRKSFVGYPKHMLAGPDCILIDDRDKTVKSLRQPVERPSLFLARGTKATHFLQASTRARAIGGLCTTSWPLNFTHTAKRPNGTNLPEPRCR